MRGAGEPRDLDFDPEIDSQNMSVFEKGKGKEWLETMFADKLGPHEGTCVDIRECPGGSCSLRSVS